MLCLFFAWVIVCLCEIKVCDGRSGWSPVARGWSAAGPDLKLTPPPPPPARRCRVHVTAATQGSGRPGTSHFTATFPYLVLIILFFRSVTLEGAGEGIFTTCSPTFPGLATPTCG